MAFADVMVKLDDAFELESLSIPIRDPNTGSVGMQHQTMLKPIGVAVQPTTVFVRPDLIQFMADLDGTTMKKYENMYKGLLGDLQAHRAAEAGIQIVSGLNGPHKA